MKGGFKIIDSDMHLREPADLWEKYMEPEWRDQAPRIISSPARSSAMVLLDGKILGGYPPTYRGGIFDATRIDAELADAKRRSFDAVSQLNAMDREGLDVAALYPSIGLGIMMRDEINPKLAAAIARAYNNWLYDFCQTDPKRLKGVAMISLHDVTEAVKVTVSPSSSSVSAALAAGIAVSAKRATSVFASFSSSSSFSSLTKPMG